MTNFDEQYAWQQRFLPQVAKIIAPYMVRVAPMEEDQKRNTDMMMLKVDGVRVGVRTRKFEYLASFGDEFTIRSELPSGTKTELAKIIEGWGDLLFYGFADDEEHDIAAWMIGDLGVFRRWMCKMLWDRNAPRPIARRNADGSKFLAFRIDDLPDDFLVARKTWTPPPHNGHFVSPAPVPRQFRQISKAEQLGLVNSNGGAA